MYDSGDLGTDSTAAPTDPASSAPAAPAAGASDVAVPAPPPNVEPASGVTNDQVKLALRRVKDPELNLNILDLGLVYEIAVDGSDVKIDMSLTSPGCPSGPEIMGDAERQLQEPGLVAAVDAGAD
jgi:metal-sulfur cluster biosynthetic enzyme